MLRVITTSTPQRGEKSSATIQKSIGTVGGEAKIAINYMGFVVLLCQKPAPLLHGLESKPWKIAKEKFSFVNHERQDRNHYVF